MRENDVFQFKKRINVKRKEPEQTRQTEQKINKNSISLIEKQKEFQKQKEGNKLNTCFILTPLSTIPFKSFSSQKEIERVPGLDPISPFPYIQQIFVLYPIEIDQNTKVFNGSIIQGSIECHLDGNGREEEPILKMTTGLYLSDISDGELPVTFDEMKYNQIANKRSIVYPLFNTQLEEGKEMFDKEKSIKVDHSKTYYKRKSRFIKTFNQEIQLTKRQNPKKKAKAGIAINKDYKFFYFIEISSQENISTLKVKPYLTIQLKLRK